MTTAVEHHADLLSWWRHARLRVVDVDERGVVVDVTLWWPRSTRGPHRTCWR